MADDEGDAARPRRGTRARGPGAHQGGPLTWPSGPTGRPSAHENAEAQEYIDAMTQTLQLRGGKAAVSTNTIALALAWRRDDAELDGLAQTDRNRLFGVPAHLRTREEWVDDPRLETAEAYLACDAAGRQAFVAPPPLTPAQREARGAAAVLCAALHQRADARRAPTNPRIARRPRQRRAVPAMRATPRRSTDGLTCSGMTLCDVRADHGSARPMHESRARDGCARERWVRERTMGSRTMGARVANDG